MTGRGEGALTGGLVLVALLIGAWLLFGGQEQRLTRSAIGFDALQEWLVANGVEARSFGGGYAIDPDSVGLRVLPLYDLGPGQPAARPRTHEDMLRAEDQRDIDLDTIRRKAALIPTLLVLPKWRAGMVYTGTAHPDFLVSRARLTGLARRLMSDGAGIATAGEAFTRIAVGDGTAEIYQMQTLQSPGCTPLIGTAEAMLLARCDLAGATAELGGAVPVLVLSDPDLLDAHGLGLGDNAAIALTLLRDQAAGRPILIDETTRVWAQRLTGARAPDRTWADLLRYFAWPFSGLWAGAGGVLALFLWRSWVRFGAPVRLFATGPEGTRRAALTARARLLRLSGAHAALLADFAELRLGQVRAELLGPQAAAHRVDLAPLLRRRAPEAGPALLAAADALRAATLPLTAAAAVARLAQFEALITQARHEFDRTP